MKYIFDRPTVGVCEVSSRCPVELKKIPSPPRANGHQKIGGRIVAFFFLGKGWTNGHNLRSYENEKRTKRLKS